MADASATIDGYTSAPAIAIEVNWLVLKRLAALIARNSGRK